MICNIAIPYLSQNKLRHYSLSWSFLLSLQTESIIKGLCFSILIYICLWWSTVRKIREGFCCSSRTFSMHLFFFSSLCLWKGLWELLLCLASSHHSVPPRWFYLFSQQLCFGRGSSTPRCLSLSACMLFPGLFYTLIYLHTNISTWSKQQVNMQSLDCL